VEEISFIAYLAPISTALKFDGRAEGGRITLEVPESETPELSKMLLLREQTFQVTITPLGG
jgi:hypothetical protein